MGAPRDSRLTFGGAGTQEIQYTGRHIRVLDTPVAPVFITIEGVAGEFERGAGQQLNLAPSDPMFKLIRVRSAVAQTVVVSVSDVPQDDNRSNVALTVGATVAGSTAATKAGAVTVPAGGSIMLIAANSDRQEVRLGVASDQPGGVWFSDDPGQGDAEGGFLDVGMVDYVATLSALYAHNPHATLDVVVNVLDMETP